MDEMRVPTKEVTRLLQYLSASNADARKARAQASDVLTSFFTYVGVAVTPCVAGAAGGALQRQGFSATRGGLMTIVNTGTDVLRAGDKVRMVIDVVDVIKGGRDHCCYITGIPNSKIVARLAHVRPDATTFADVAEGVTSRALALRVNEPGVLTPMMQYVGRLRFPWDWDKNSAVDPRIAFPSTCRVFKPLPMGISNQHLAIAQTAFGTGLEFLDANFKNSNFADKAFYINTAGECERLGTEWVNQATRILDADFTGRRDDPYPNLPIDLWMLLMIRLCEFYSYVASINEDMAADAWTQIKRLITAANANRRNNEWAPVFVEVRLLKHRNTTVDGTTDSAAQNPLGYRSVAGRLNALHTMKTEKFDAYTNYGRDYNAAETQAEHRDNWNTVQTAETEEVTARLVHSIYDPWEERGGRIAEITDAVDIDAWRTRTADVNNLMTSAFLSEHSSRHGAIWPTETKAFRGGGRLSGDAAVNHAVIVKILTSRGG
jgi:hypothetical protein